MVLQQQISHSQVSRKFNSSKRLRSLLAAAHERGDKAAEVRYVKALGCQSVYVERNGVWVPSRRCRTRACLVCRHLDSYILVKRYGPALVKLTDAQFVTLTSPNVRAEAIGHEFDRYVDVLRRCRTKMRRARLPMVGIRSFEVTFKTAANGKAFNVHSHFIVEGADAAELLRQCWIKLFPRKVNPAAQIIEPIEDGSVEKALSYGTKPSKVYGLPGHDIYSALHGRRLFAAYGIKSIPKPLKDERTAVYRDDIVRAIYDDERHDYIGVDDGLPITGFNPLTDGRTPDKIKTKLRRGNIGPLIHS